MVFDKRWTAEDYTLIRAMASQGDSFATVARFLAERTGEPVSRSAVAGLARRHRIKFGRADNAQAAIKDLQLVNGWAAVKVDSRLGSDESRPKRRRMPKIKLVSPPVMSPEQRKKLLERSKPIRCVDAESNQCLWPMGHERQGIPLCCGRKVLSGRPYCADHDTKGRGNRSRYYL